MARLSRTLVVLIAATCIVLILLFLTVKEVGRFSAHLSVSSLRAQRALPEEISLVVTVLVLTVLISCARGESESFLASSALSLWFLRIGRFSSALRC
jgi:hypothetical protein